MSTFISSLNTATPTGKIADVVSPSMRGKMVPNAPPQPTSEDLHLHYLDRNRTIENANNFLHSAMNYVSEVASDLTAALPSTEDMKAAMPTAFGLAPQVDDNGIPIPPPLPSKDARHMHYLIPKAPAMPTIEQTHKHYLIPKAPPMPSADSMHRHYLSRDRTLENASNILRSAAYTMSDFAAQLRANLPSAADLGLAQKLDAYGIPVPPPMPVREMLHKHYLIPAAPPMPSRESTHGHYLIPAAPPLPTSADYNKHYLSRNKTIENAGNVARSYATYASEVASDLKDAVVNSVPSTTSSIPAPPPMPSREALHKHYLSRPSVRSNKAYPVDMSQQEREIVDQMYTPAVDITPAQSSPMFSFSKFRRMANNAASSIMSKLSTTPVDNLSSQSHIPVPPPLPTNESLHKHYLIPLAPPLPTSADLHRHYLSRDKTIENAGSYFTNAVHFVSEVVSEVKDYVLETPITTMSGDLKERLAPTPVDNEGIPIPPAMPTREAQHKHYLIPLAPALPSNDQLHKHYLSRDRTMENASRAIKDAINYASDVVVDNAVAAKEAVVDGAIATKDAAVQLPETVSNASTAAAESAQRGLTTAVDAVVDGATSLKEKIVPSTPRSPIGLKYARSEVISESPILKKRQTAGSRRIVARQNYSGFKPLIQSIPQRI